MSPKASAPTSGPITQETNPRPEPTVMWLPCSTMPYSAPRAPKASTLKRTHRYRTWSNSRLAAIQIAAVSPTATTMVSTVVKIFGSTKHQ